jgi:hypothetical protein
MGTLAVQRVFVGDWKSSQISCTGLEPSGRELGDAALFYSLRCVRWAGSAGRVLALVRRARTFARLRARNRTETCAQN